MNQTSLKNSAILAAGLMAVSTAAIIIRWTGDTPPLVVAAYRLTIAGIILSMLSGWWRKSDFIPSSVSDFFVLGVAGLALALHFTFWITSLRMTTIASSVVLVATAPIWAAVFSRLILKEKLNAQKIIGIILALTGSAIIAYASDGFGETSLTGNILALAGGIMAAVYLTAGRIARRTKDTLSYAAIVYLIAAAIVILLAIIRKETLTGYSGDIYILMILLALLPQLIGHTIFNWALKKRSAVTVSVVLMGEPIGATILAMIILAEFPGAAEIAGGIIILTGIYLSSVN